MKSIDLKTIQRIETSILCEVDNICKNNGIEYYLLCGSVLGAVRHGGPIPWDSDADIGVPIDKIELFLDVVKSNLSNKYYIEYCLYSEKSASIHPEIFAKGIDGRVLHVDVYPLFGMPENKSEQMVHWKKIKKCMQDLHCKRFAYIGNRDDHSIKTSIKRIIHYSKCLFKYPFLDKSETIIQRYFSLLNAYSFRDSKYSTFPCVGNSTRAITETKLYGNGCRIGYDGFELSVPEYYDEYLREMYGDYMTPPPKSERSTVTKAMVYQKEYEKYWKTTNI